MTGVYERALGDSLAAVQPKVRERYVVGAGDAALVGRGRMDVTRGTHVLPMLYAMASADLLFPEAGRDVPFTVTSVGTRIDDGREALVFTREFEFPNVRRRFDSVTVWDAENDRLLDFLGRGGRLVTELRPFVESGGVTVESGRQWLRIGSRYVRIPRPFDGSVRVRERYDEADGRYHVAAIVENALAGHVFSYRGSFTQQRRDPGDLPADVRMARRFPELPPA